MHRVVFLQGLPHNSGCIRLGGGVRAWRERDGARLRGSAPLQGGCPAAHLLEAWKLGPCTVAFRVKSLHEAERMSEHKSFRRCCIGKPARQFGAVCPSPSPASPSPVCRPTAQASLRLPRAGVPRHLQALPGGGGGEAAGPGEHELQPGRDCAGGPGGLPATQARPPATLPVSPPPRCACGLAGQAQVAPPKHGSGAQLLPQGDNGRACSMCTALSWASRAARCPTCTAMQELGHPCLLPAARSLRVVKPLSPPPVYPLPPPTPPADHEAAEPPAPAATVLLFCAQGAPLDGHAVRPGRLRAQHHAFRLPRRERRPPARTPRRFADPRSGDRAGSDAGRGVPHAGCSPAAARCGFALLAHPCASAGLGGR